MCGVCDRFAAVAHGRVGRVVTGVRVGRFGMGKSAPWAPVGFDLCKRKHPCPVSVGPFRFGPVNFPDLFAVAVEQVFDVDGRFPTGKPPRRRLQGPRSFNKPAQPGIGL